MELQQQVNDDFFELLVYKLSIEEEATEKNGELEREEKEIPVILRIFRKGDKFFKVNVDPESRKIISEESAIPEDFLKENYQKKLKYNYSFEYYVKKWRNFFDYYYNEDIINS